MTPILRNSKRPWNAAAIQEHVRLLVLHCLPRLIAGTELYDLDRKTASNAGVFRGLVLWVAGDRTSTGISRAKEWLAILMLLGLGVTVARLARDSARSAEPARRAISGGVLGSALLIVAAFLVNRNIFNSDNYRYLIYLLTPWSLGFGLVLDEPVAPKALRSRGGLGRRGIPGRGDELVHIDLVSRYTSLHQQAWRCGQGPASTLVGAGRSGTSESPAQSTGRARFAIPSDVTHVFGGYWDVYRIAFLSGKQVVGIPFSIVPESVPGLVARTGAGPRKAARSATT